LFKKTHRVKTAATLTHGGIMKQSSPLFKLTKTGDPMNVPIIKDALAKHGESVKAIDVLRGSK